MQPTRGDNQAAKEVLMVVERREFFALETVCPRFMAGVRCRAGAGVVLKK